jgi:hypothetical protein
MTPNGGTFRTPIDYAYDYTRIIAATAELDFMTFIITILF